MALSRLPSAAALVFGCVPDTDDVDTRAHIADICAYLTEHVGVSVTPHRSPSPAALASAYRAGRVTIAWVSPTLLLTSSAMESSTALVSAVRQGLTAYHSVLYVAEDASIRSAVDLKGCRAAWVAPTSAAGYLFPRLALASYGFDPSSLFKQEKFYGSHGNVARAVLEGEADVGGGYAVFENGNPAGALVRAPFVDLISDRRGRVLLTTDPIPSDLIVASRDVSSVHRARLMRAFEDVENDPCIAAVRSVLGADGFRRFDPRVLQPLRDQIECGRTLGLLDESLPVA